MTTRVKRFVARRTGAWAKLFLQTGLAALALWLIWGAAADRLAGFDGALALSLLAETPAWALAAALVCAAVSYAAVSCYDLVVFRALGVAAPRTALLRAGFTATALGQSLGFGLIVGGFARWRMLRDHGVGPARAGAATAMVSAGFFLGLTVVIAGAVAMAPQVAAAVFLTDTGSVQAVAGAALACFAAIAAAAALGVRPARLVVTQALLALLDLAPAALALWLLLPAIGGLGYVDALTAYSGALGLALISNAPAGAGALEGALLAALPMATAEALIAAVLAFRLAFYALPFLIALAFLARREAGEAVAAADAPRIVPAARIAGAIAASGRAEDNLAWTGDKRFLFAAGGDGFVMYGSRGRALVAMGDPVGPRRCWPELVDGFLALARRDGLAPVFYKAGPAVAALCRSRGLAADRIGHEAVVDPQSFDLTTPARRQLRRKTRQAEKAGVELIWREPGEADMTALARISAAWSGARRESGFSMGRFAPAYVARFPVIEAHVGGAPVGFVSLWRGGDGKEWAVDLMRGLPEAPQGAMQALLVGAIMAARDAGADDFNLCMAPLAGLETPGTATERLLGWVYARGARWHGLQGLRRFKASFDPEWRPRFVAREAGAASAFLAARRLISAPPSAAQPAVSPAPARDRMPASAS